jgi:ATP-dependent helicase/nuclease subunit A
MQQSSVGHWVLLHAMSRAEAKVLDEILKVGDRRQEIAYAIPWDFKWRRGEDYLSVPRRVRGKIGGAGEMDPEQLSERLRALSWKYPNPAPANIPSKLTATQLKGRVLDSEIAEETQVKEEAGKPIYRPEFIVRERGLTPAQRGTALHLVMEKLPLDADLSEEGIRTFVETLVQEDYLTRQQGDAISVKQVAGFYQSPLGKKLSSAKTCRREFKFSLLVDAGAYFPQAHGEELMLQGVVDLWFEDGDGITVVDFKSDHVLPGEERARAEEYRPQLEAYSKALKTILGVEKLKTVLWFFATGTAVEL